MSTTEPLHYIFIAGDVRTNDGTIAARQATLDRLSQKYWALPENASHRKLLKPNDRVVFYAAGKFAGSVFIASATLLTDAAQRSPRIRREKEYKYDFLLATPYGVELTNINIFPQTVSAKDLLSELSFTRAIPKWGVYFRGAVARISLNDYELILRHSQQVGS